MFCPVGCEWEKCVVRKLLVLHSLFLPLIFPSSFSQAGILSHLRPRDGSHMLRVAEITHQLRSQNDFANQIDHYRVWYILVGNKTNKAIKSNQGRQLEIGWQGDGNFLSRQLASWQLKDENELAIQRAWRRVFWTERRASAFDKCMSYRWVNSIHWLTVFQR